MPSEPPDADPHVRWCGGRRGEPGAYPIDRRLGARSEHSPTSPATALSVGLKDAIVLSRTQKHRRAGDVDIATIALWLGHESIKTTRIYEHADPKLKEQAIARIAPFGTKPGRYRPTDTLLAFLEGL